MAVSAANNLETLPLLWYSHYPAVRKKPKSCEYTKHLKFGLVGNAFPYSHLCKLGLGACDASIVRAMYIYISYGVCRFYFEWSTHPGSFFVRTEFARTYQVFVYIGTEQSWS